MDPKPIRSGDSVAWPELPAPPTRISTQPPQSPSLRPQSSLHQQQNQPQQQNQHTQQQQNKQPIKSGKAPQEQEMQSFVLSITPADEDHHTTDGISLLQKHNQQSTPSAPSLQGSPSQPRRVISSVSLSSQASSIPSQSQSQSNPQSNPQSQPTKPGANPLPPGDVADNLHTPFVHLYRAELGRVTAYRQRIDTVTNWAITTTGVLVTFTLSRDEIPHTFFLFILLLNALFLLMETRRYIFYELALRRCRIVEIGWIGVLTGVPDADVEWMRRLGKAYGLHPGLLPFRISVCLRLQRNYIWMLWTVAVGWTIKLMSDEGFQWFLFL
eukprot:TRINITY_DN6871_c0_g1_i1.p1 TRINITY_DN6871_c0_g1~~TRINITY_DN6871_c0_g1_i1.p1  ORF type:complete len:326 (+),score=89.84 TRINITY_DN6871_c0_g1_i1:42-1019(+)